MGVVVGVETFDWEGVGVFTVVVVFLLTKKTRGFRVFVGSLLQALHTFQGASASGGGRLVRQSMLHVGQRPADSWCCLVSKQKLTMAMSQGLVIFPTEQTTLLFESCPKSEENLEKS